MPRAEYSSLWAIVGGRAPPGCQLAAASQRSSAAAHDGHGPCGAGGRLGGSKSEEEMSIPQQTSSIFELKFPQSVAIYQTYSDAQKAVDYLADERFEVKNLAIVGTDLKSVERVLGRRTWGTVIGQGVQSGVDRSARRSGDVDLHETGKHPGLADRGTRDRHQPGYRFQRRRVRHDARPSRFHIGQPDCGDQVRSAV